MFMSCLVPVSPFHRSGDVEPQLLQLAESSESFLQLCPEPGEAFESIPSSAMVPASWAEHLLEKQPGLKQTRFRLVPSKVSEDNFWDRYFAAIFRLLEAELTAEATKGRAKTGPVQTEREPMPLHSLQRYLPKTPPGQAASRRHMIAGIATGQGICQHLGPL